MPAELPAPCCAGEAGLEWLGLEEVELHLTGVGEAFVLQLTGRELGLHGIFAA
jgi:hypothetical protein